MNENVNVQNPLNLIDQDIAMENNATPANSTQSNPAPVESNNTSTISTQDSQANVTTSTPAPQEGQKQDIFDKLILKFVKFLAKVSGQPDPQYGSENTSSNTATNQTENTQATEAQDTDKIDFNSVMSGVSGFMDKVGKTKIVSNVSGFFDKVGNQIENTTGINLGSQTPVPETTNAQPAASQAVPTSTEQVAAAPVQPVEPAQPVQPVEPAQPVQPVQPAQPVQPVEPAQQVAPTPVPETPTAQQ